jgi:hypothetical protein
VPLPLFEPLCIAIIAITLAMMARQRPWKELLADYAALAVAGWVGEHTCVTWYEYYGYAPMWHGRLGAVPVMVPLIWPLVIMSARDVVRSIAPQAGRWAPILVGALVVFDASLVEVIAVRAGLWRWAEPGHLGVPVLGIIGWGFFAALAHVALERPLVQRPLALVIALVGTHLLILAAWWGLFRWVIRGDHGDASLVGLCVLSLAALAGGLYAVRAGGALPLAVGAPRMAAAALFFALLVKVAPDDVRLWIHVACVAVPYLVVTALTGTRSPAGLPRATSQSR